MAIPPLAFAWMYSAILAAWLQLFFLRPLGSEAMDMHERQLDPTEIIEVPYDLQRLAIYVSAVVCAVLVDPSGWRKFVHLFQLSAVCTVLFVICGASPYNNRLHTVLAATYFATLCWFDPPIFYATNARTLTLRDSFRRRLRGQHGNFVSAAKQQQDVLALTIFYSCVIFTVPMQILLLYDRGWQAQRWPVPVLLGSTIGWIVGTCLGTILATTNNKLGRSSNKKQEEVIPGDSSTAAADTATGRKD